jgi:hypothetical protein
MDNAPRVLGDGSYDAIVVDADTAADGALVVDLTILAGEHKGEIVTVRAANTRRDPLDLLGVPATLVVASGQPAVTFEG